MRPPYSGRAGLLTFSGLRAFAHPGTAGISPGIRGHRHRLRANNTAPGRAPAPAGRTWLRIITPFIASHRVRTAVPGIGTAATSRPGIRPGGIAGPGRAAAGRAGPSQRPFGRAQARFGITISYQSISLANSSPPFAPASRRAAPGTAHFQFLFRR